MQASCAIKSVVALFGTTLVLRVVFKTKQLSQSRLLSIQPKSQTRTLTPSLHRRRPPRQSCHSCAEGHCVPCTNCPIAGRGERASRSRTSKSRTLRLKWFCKIHEVQGASGNKNHCPAAEVLSTVQRCWLQPCQRQYHLRLGCSLRQRRELASTGKAEKERKKQLAKEAAV